MMRTRHLFCSGAMAAALLCLGPAASLRSAEQQPTPQQPAPQQPTFRSGTALVEVDVIVLDKQGNFVPGLKAEDLTLFEDGKAQKIQQFYMVTYNPASGIPAQYADVADYRARRVFVFLFDEGHLDNESVLRAGEGAEAFIREQMSPGDMGGVFVNNGMFHSRLTTDKAELLAGVRTLRPQVDNRQSILAPFREFPRIPSETDATRIADGARELVVALGARACVEDPQDCEAAGGLQQVENLLQQKARLYVRQARMLTSNTLHNLQTVARGLARMPGRKTVVLVSEGFYVEDARGQLQTIAAEAARGGTTIYSLDARGLVNHMSPNPDVIRRERARSTVFDTGEDGPNILTAGTGGFMVRNVDDMSRALGLIARDTSTYYVIGYQPENSKMDGKYRRIEVKTRNGLKVRARKGYAAVELLPFQQPIWGPPKG